MSRTEFPASLHANLVNTAPFSEFTRLCNRIMSGFSTAVLPINGRDSYAQHVREENLRKAQRVEAQHPMDIKTSEPYHAQHYAELYLKNRTFRLHEFRALPMKY